MVNRESNFHKFAFSSNGAVIRSRSRSHVFLNVFSRIMRGIAEREIRDTSSRIHQKRTFEKRRFERYSEYLLLRSEIFSFLLR